MNARLATEQNEVLINDLLTASKEMATRKGITVSEAIDYKVSVYLKYATSSNETLAWEIRGEKAKALLS